MREIAIPSLGLAGTLHIPRAAYAIVVFARGSGASRFSQHNRAVADKLNAQGFATLLFDDSLLAGCQKIGLAI
jgi:putative phosphoribosyl transferase